MAEDDLSAFFSDIAAVESTVATTEVRTIHAHPPSHITPTPAQPRNAHRTRTPPARPPARPHSHTPTPTHSLPHADDDCGSRALRWAAAGEARKGRGGLELQKQAFVGQAAEHQRDLNKLQDKLEKTYGKIQIDINNGSFKPIEEEAEVAEEV